MTDACFYVINIQFFPGGVCLTGYRIQNNGCQASPDILMLNNRESPNSLFYDSPFLSFYTTSSILRMM